MRGLTITENPMGITAVRLHYSADPSKDPDNPNPELAERALEWLNQQKSLWPDPNDFEREFEINFFIGKGSRVFPQFSQTYHARPIQVNRRKVVYRSWDFGWITPACLIAQVDTHERLCVLRELVGLKKTTKDFAQDVLKKCGEWFPLHSAGFEDFCDPAGQHTRAIESEKSEKRDVEILAGLGIHPRYEYGWSRKDGRSLVHQLLALRADGTPGLYVDGDACPITLQAFLGRYVYPTRKDGKTAEDPDDDTHPWADVMGALRYLVTGLKNKLGLRALGRISYLQTAPAALDVGFHGYGTVKR